MVKKKPELKEKDTKIPGWTAVYSLETRKSLYYQTINRFIIHSRRLFPQMHHCYIIMQLRFRMFNDICH